MTVVIYLTFDPNVKSRVAPAGDAPVRVL